MEFVNFNLVSKYIQIPLKFPIQNRDNKGKLIFLLITTIKDIWYVPASKVLFKKN